LDRSRSIRLVVASVAGLVVFVVFPLAPISLFLTTFAVRAGFAGLACGLAIGSAADWRFATAAGVAAGLAGALVVSLVAPAMGVTVTWYFVAAGSAGLCAGLARFAASRGLNRSVVLVAILGLLASFLWLTGTLPGAFVPAHANRVAFLSEPRVAGQYRFDGDVYMVTALNMKRGMSFYPAFSAAVHGDVRYTPVSLRSVFNFRQPLIFLVWQALPGSTIVDVWDWFLVFACVVVVAAYLLASRFVNPGASLVSAVISMSYLYYFAMERSWFMFAEVWAGGIMVMALAALVRKRWLLSAVLFTVAVGIREFSIVFLVPWLAAWWLDEDRSLLAAATAVVAPVAVLLLHMMLAPTEGAGGGGGGLSLGPWLHGSFDALIGALRYGTHFLISPDWTVPAALVLALVGALMVRERRHAVPLALAVVVPTVFLTVFSAGASGIYWGAFAVPVFLAMVPLVGVRLVPSTEEALADAAEPRDQPALVRFVLPAYNEEASVGELVERIAEIMDAEGQPYNVLVIDDGSADRTAAIVRDLGKRLPVTVNPNKKNLGLGRTIRRGLLLASKAAKPGDVIVTLDADLTQDPCYVPSMIAKWRDGADIVIASRFRPGSKVAGVSVLRQITTWGARAVVSTLMPVEGVRDYSCGFRLYDTAVLRGFFSRLGEDAVTDTSFAAMVEIVLEQRHRARFAEVPFELHYEEKRKASTMNVSRTASSYFGVIARTRWLELTRAA
jgi:dolichol-phosphate mannosyltransferase